MMISCRSVCPSDLYFGGFTSFATNHSMINWTGFVKSSGVSVPPNWSVFKVCTGGFTSPPRPEGHKI